MGAVFFEDILSEFLRKIIGKGNPQIIDFLDLGYIQVGVAVGNDQIKTFDICQIFLVQHNRSHGVYTFAGTMKGTVAVHQCGHGVAALSVQHLTAREVYAVFFQHPFQVLAAHIIGKIP